MNIGVIDQGFVGNAVYQEFKSFFKVYTYDIVTKRCNVELVREFMSKLNKETKALIVNKFTVFP